MKLGKVYSEYASQPDSESRQVLDQSHWFISHAEFDPRSGDALPQNLSAFLHKASTSLDTRPLKDRLWRIVDHCEDAVRKIIRTLNESPRREHTEMHVRNVRELDVNSFIKLSQRPGRNFRQKLASKPYLNAVRRYQSIDLPENRLLKEFIVQISELLEHREQYIGDDLGEFYDRIHLWKRSETADLISRWDNPPPNNTLLSHREYRRLYDSWTWLQSLEQDLKRDLSHLSDREATKKNWHEEAQIYLSGQTLFADQPLQFDLEKFAITPWDKDLQKLYRGQQITRPDKNFRVQEPSCIDFSDYPIAHSRTPTHSSQLLDHFIFQRWKHAEEQEEQFDLKLFHSDAAWLHGDCTTISLPQVIFDTELDEGLLKTAARELSRQLRHRFDNDHLVWLTPDSVNDFQLRPLRSNLNLFFSKAEPLPRSIAAVLEQIVYADIPKEGFSVLVTDEVGGKGYATRLVALYDEDLENEVPETRGFIWERCPPVQVKTEKFSQNLEKEIPTVSKNHKWKTQPSVSNFQEEEHVIEIPESIEEWDEHLHLYDPPIKGGDHYLKLRTVSETATLWRDQIPPLSITVPDNNTGLLKRLELVGIGHRIKPILWEAVSIPIDTNFVIPPEHNTLVNPLLQGAEGSDQQVGYSLVVSSPELPTSTPVDCELQLSFKYGDDNPYNLRFVPHDGSIRPIDALWEKTSKKTAEAPAETDFPVWKNLRRWYSPQEKTHIDFIAKIIERISKVETLAEKTPQHLISSINSLLNRIPIAWSNGKSISDKDCPIQLRKPIQKLLSLENHSSSKLVEECIYPMISRLHRDTTENCVKWLMKQAKRKQKPCEVGLSLGKRTEKWQEEIFTTLIKNISNYTVRVFAYAAWNDNDFIQNLSVSEINKLLEAVYSCMKDVPHEKNKRRFEEMRGGGIYNKQKRREFYRFAAEPLELLLAFLRTRTFADENYRNLILPGSDLANKLSEANEDIAEFFQIGLKTPFHSRLHVDVKKEFTLHELSYVLRLYLTGIDSSHTIRVSLSDA
jgi:hypothetical protein